jgi:hypothetical protein
MPLRLGTERPTSKVPVWRVYAYSMQMRCVRGTLHVRQISARVGAAGRPRVAKKKERSRHTFWGSHQGSSDGATRFLHCSQLNCSEGEVMKNVLCVET